MSAYRPRRLPQSRVEAVRGLQLHALCWPAVPEPASETVSETATGAAAPLRVLLHGWMDLGASFQFLVDCFDPQVAAVALDWRGFGGSEPRGVDAYWFPDYLADLDVWLDRLSPAAPVDLIAHSMGANIAMGYAAARPERVRRLVNLEGFGLPDADPAEAPQRLRRWLDELKQPVALTPYASLDAVAARLRKNNPRLTLARAQWLAAQWSEAGPDGRHHLRADPAYKRINPVLYRRAELLATWAAIEAPTLFIEGEDDTLAAYWPGRFPRAELDARLACVPRLTRLRLPACGHMLHHDQPEALAQAIEGFLGA